MKLLLSSIILILSYYPVHADRLSREESRNILLKGEVLGFKNFDSQDYLKGLLEDDNRLVAVSRTIIGNY